jgi:hypothetical protein
MKTRVLARPFGKATLLLVYFLIITAAPSWLAIAQKRGSSRPLNKPLTPSGWYMFKGPDGDFSLAFPSEPAPYESDVEGPVTIIRHYHLSTKDGKYFSVNIQDTGGNPRSRDANEFDQNNEATVSLAARERGERVVQVHRLAKNIFEMEVWQPVKDSANKLNRLDHAILHRGRLYTLGCGSLIDNKEVDKTICRKFFKSIRFIK